MQPELITVAVCTYNRAESLRRTLSAINQMNTPEGLDWELIVVNNNSTDNTESVVSEFVDRTDLPIRYAFEPAQGASHARNHAVGLACGTHIVWTDDDVIVGRHWLSSYIEAIRSKPEAAVFGGPIRPRFEGTPPPWLKKTVSSIPGAFALRDLGDWPVRLGATTVPFGANMALRTAEQRQNLYDPRYGPGSAGGMLGEETTIVRKILASGKEGWWVPRAIVDHVIPQQRQTIQYVWNWYEAYGRFLVSTCASSDAAGARLFGVPRWLWRAAAVSQIRYYWSRVMGSPEEWISELTAAAEYRGQLKRHLGVR